MKTCYVKTCRSCVDKLLHPLGMKVHQLWIWWKNVENPNPDNVYIFNLGVYILQNKKYVTLGVNTFKHA